MLKLIFPVLIVLAGCLDPKDVHVGWRTDRESPTIPAAQVGASIHFFNGASGADSTWFYGYTNATVVQADSGDVCVQLTRHTTHLEEQFGQDVLVDDYQPLSDEVCDKIDMSVETPSETFQLVLR